MTEQEWSQATDPQAMLEFLRGKTSERKLRLFACSVCRQLASFVGTREYIRGIEAAEAYADGGRMKAAMKRCRQALNERMVSLVDTSGHGQSDEWNALFLGHVAICEKDYRSFPTCLSYLQSGLGGDSVKKAISVSYLNVRDIFGNPFRPITIDPAWLTWHGGLLVSMSQQMYASRDFRDMPVLADALEEAGCQDQDILAHCRSGGEHVRGCWVVDLILGSS